MITMKIKLAYGRQGLMLDLPDHLERFSPRFINGLSDESSALRAALGAPIAGPPLRSLLHPGQSVVIVHTDITRATPNDRILPVLLAEITMAGIRREDITLLNGLGTHRPQTDPELREMLGDQIVENYRCLQHDCHDTGNLISLGTTSAGHPVRINRTYLDADVKILTGFIEPHFFAGFSGGPKAVLPSLAGAESVFTNHGFNMIAHPKAAWGKTEGNPIWEEMKEVALLTRPDFLVNVALNNQHQITGIFTGEMLAAHRAGCDFVRETALVPVDAPYDFVLTTNSGYPLDQNLYQTVKGMSAAARITRPGGAIIMAAACEDGLPDHGAYKRLLTDAGSPKVFLQQVGQPGFEVQDQWQVQIQAQIQLQAQVYVYADGLTDQQILDAWLHPCRDIPELVQRLIAEVGPRGCVIPDGPQVIPTVVD
jgi:lactate racemase